MGKLLVLIAVEGKENHIGCIRLRLVLDAGSNFLRVLNRSICLGPDGLSCLGVKGRYVTRTTKRRGNGGEKEATTMPC